MGGKGEEFSSEKNPSKVIVIDSTNNSENYQSLNFRVMSRIILYGFFNLKKLDRRHCILSIRTLEGICQA